MHKIIVTYEAGDLPLKALAKRPSSIKARDAYIMYVGTCFPHKNLKKLVDSFDILKEQHPDLKLVFVGKRDIHSEELEQYAASHPTFADIIFTGFASNEELKWLFEHCQAYVFPSLSEGFGLPGIEAMIHGAPVVSSDATCLPEVYGDAAHYFNPNNSKDMAKKISEVISDPKLQKTLKENATVQVKKYSWHRMAEETLLVYKELLDETVK